MKFCKNCHFIYYIKLNIQYNKYIYYCKNCGDEDTDLEVNEFNIYTYEIFIIFIIFLILLLL